MSLEIELQRIMDMYNPWEEAKKKLYETWVIVNGKPLYLRSFVNNSIVEGKLSGLANNVALEVKSMDVFLPESGLYPTTKGNACLIVKKPKRQWQKSYSEYFYTIKMIGSKTTQPKNYIEEVFNSRRVDIFKEANGDIYYWENLIGKEKEGKLLCYDKNFEQELKDWRRDATVHV